MIIIGVMLLLAVGLLAQKTRTENLLNFDISPNPMEKYCKINLDFANEAYISLVIMNNQEEVIKTLYTGPVYKNLSLTWEREDVYGNYVPGGTYHVVVKYESRYTSTKKTLILK